MASRCLKKFQQKNKVVSSGNWQLTITGLEVWCLFNCANLSCRDKSKKWSGAWNKIHFKESPIQHMSGWHSCISIRLQNQRWSVVSSTPTRGNFIFFCWNLLKPLDVNFVQKCQICVICENFSWHLLTLIHCTFPIPCKWIVAHSTARESVTYVLYIELHHMNKSIKPHHFFPFN